MNEQGTSSEMSQDAAPPPPIRIQAIVLLNAEFTRAESLPEDPKRNIEGEFSITAREPENDRIRVDLTVIMQDVDVWRVSVTYALVVEKTGEFPHGSDPERIWATIAERVAPTILYPYAREAVTNLLTKAELPSVMPPIVDFGQGDRVTLGEQGELDLDPDAEETPK